MRRFTDASRDRLSEALEHAGLAANPSLYDVERGDHLTLTLAGRNAAMVPGAPERPSGMPWAASRDASTIGALPVLPVGSAHGRALITPPTSVPWRRRRSATGVKRGRGIGSRDGWPRSPPCCYSPAGSQVRSADRRGPGSSAASPTWPDSASCRCTLDTYNSSKPAVKADAFGRAGLDGGLGRCRPISRSIRFR